MLQIITAINRELATRYILKQSKVLAPGLGKTKTGRILHMLGMGGPYGETEPPAVCYFYSPDPKGQRQKKHF